MGSQFQMWLYSVLIPTEAVKAVSTAVWTLDHLKYTYLEG